jgi:hypothetical protein
MSPSLRAVPAGKVILIRLSDCCCQRLTGYLVLSDVGKAMTSEVKKTVKIKAFISFKCYLFLSKIKFMIELIYFHFDLFHRFLYCSIREVYFLPVL